MIAGISERLPRVGKATLQSGNSPALILSCLVQGSTGCVVDRNGQEFRMGRGGKKKGMERVMGIEPTLSAWEAEVLPLNYTRAESILRSFGQPHNRRDGRTFNHSS